MPVLSVYDNDGNKISIPAIRGEQGPKGDTGESYVLTSSDKEEIAGMVTAEDKMDKEDPTGTGILSIKGTAQIGENDVSGNYSAAVGYSNKVTTNDSFAAGSRNTVKGDFSFAFGYNCQANYDASYAEGENCVADNYFCHVEGDSNTAIHEGSHVEGEGNESAGTYSHVQGKFADTSNKHADVVGNGVSTINRSNAYTLDWNGDAWFAGDVYTGGTSKQTGSKLMPSVSASDSGKALIVDSTGTIVAGEVKALPDVTTSDNGKILMVVNGQWAVATTTVTEATPYAEEVSF